MSEARVIQRKICLLGSFAVGKTSLIRRFVEGRFDDKYLSTIGVKISRKTLDRDTYQLKLLVWDLAGDGNPSRISDNYLRGAVGAIVVCDLTRPETLPALDLYSQKLRALNPQAALLFVGNKVDLTDECVIGYEELAARANRWQIPCLLTSAKTGQNVEAAFMRLAEQLEAG